MRKTHIRLLGAAGTHARLAIWRLPRRGATGRVVLLLPAWPHRVLAFPAWTRLG